MKRKIALVFTMIGLIALTAFGCDNAKLPSIGKYYVDGQVSNAHIEIFDEDELEFFNIDFSAIQENLFAMGFEVDLSETLSGRLRYTTSEAVDRIYVDLVEDIQLTLIYQDSNTIIYDGNIYTLIEENNDTN